MNLSPLERAWGRTVVGGRWSPGRSWPGFRPGIGAGRGCGLTRRCCVSVPAQGDMENCLAAAALNGMDRRSLQRSARLGQEVLERAKRRAVDWHSLELPTRGVGTFSGRRPYDERHSATGPQRLFPGEKYYSSVPEEGGATHVSRYHRRKSELHLCSDIGHVQRKGIFLGVGSNYRVPECALAASQPPEASSKDLYIEVYPGTYSVTVGANDLTKKTHVVAVDSGQSVDLVFPV
ncbi:A-kinase-interacting protein 1 [Galemys pyrenaicus]|uniref:A-kinase-interacting protein 1 n=1 Tax=Galemys pyrenaicus TaxID=202257 RepID=A0A8J6DF32_GALPY|nr:A-kinase-interacting protein 1 [Galemys pyrenaicus]